MPKQWLLKPKYPPTFAKKFPEIDSVVLQLLYNRGLDNQTSIDEFLNPDYSQDLHDPFLFQDIKKACDRILQAIKKDEKIVIHGDYDVDGVSGSAILFNTLKRLGAKNIEVYIPHRVLEGYGLNNETVKELSDKKTNLIITTDCGITNLAEIELANQLKMDVIITDHHHAPKKLPPAHAIICCSREDDSYPFKKLSGAGVAFKFSQALFIYDSILKTFPKEKSNSLISQFPCLAGRQVNFSISKTSTHIMNENNITNHHNAFEKWLLDLVALGTVADSVPLLGENRTLVKWGMYVLNKTQRVGLQELATVSSLTLESADTIDIGFKLGPRLNAAGRMDHANLAFQLLITDDLVEAIAAAHELDQKNKDRQKVTESMMTEAVRQAEEQSKNKILIIIGENWSPGLIGLVAGKITDQFYKPSFVFGLINDHENINAPSLRSLPADKAGRGEGGGKYVASGRSIDQFNIIKAVDECAEFLDHYGGHDQACGLTIFGESNFDQFKQKVNQIANQKLKTKDLVPSVHIEAEINIDDANWQLLDELEKFKPFGEANPYPIFLTKGLIIDQAEAIGKDQQTLKLIAHDSQTPDHPRKFIGFRIAQDWINKLQTGDKIDILYEIGINEWNGNREIQLKMVDLKNNRI